MGAKTLSFTGGNVGIGTATPSVPLEVVGGFFNKISSDNSNDRFKINNTLLGVDYGTIVNIESVSDHINGEYWYWFGSYNLPVEYNYYIKLQRINGEWSLKNPSGDGNTSTHIVSITPANNAIIATTSSTGATTTLSVSYYISNEDVGTFTGISVWIN